MRERVENEALDFDLDGGEVGRGGELAGGVDSCDEALSAVGQVLSLSQVGFLRKNKRL